jgi:hypothetical protein
VTPSGVFKLVVTTAIAKVAVAVAAVMVMAPRTATVIVTAQNRENISGQPSRCQAHEQAE